MSTKKVKGLLKGLRYISKVFDDEEKEPEMQIGFPTDVKHVAHIGWDGPDKINGPTWMNDFKPDRDDDHGENARVTKGKTGAGKVSIAVPTKDDNSSPVPSPSQRASDGSKKSRNRRTNPNSSLDSPTKKSGGHRSSRRNQSPAQGTEPTSHDLNQAGGTKKVRRRRKVSSEGGSTKSTKGKGSSMDGAETEMGGSEFGSRG